MSEEGKMNPRRLQSDTRASMRLAGAGGVAIGKASVPAGWPLVNSAVARRARDGHDPTLSMRILLAILGTAGRVVAWAPSRATRDVTAGNPPQTRDGK